MLFVQADKFERQVGRFMYATNSPFSLVENKEFLALMAMGRPGVKIPKRQVVAGRLLDSVYDEEWEKFKQSVAGVTMSWNICHSFLSSREESHDVHRWLVQCREPSCSRDSTQHASRAAHTLLPISFEYNYRADLNLARRNH